MNKNYIWIFAFLFLVSVMSVSAVTVQYSMSTNITLSLSAGGITTRAGVLINSSNTCNTIATCTIKVIEKPTLSGATMCYVENSARSLILANGTFSGNNCTLSTPYNMLNNTGYFITVDNIGGAYTYAYNTAGLSYPYSYPPANITADVDNTGILHTNEVNNIRFIYVDYTSGADIMLNSPSNNTIQYQYSNDILIFNITTKSFPGTSFNTTQRIYFENGTLYQSITNTSANATNYFTINQTGRYYINATTTNGTYVLNTSTYLFTLYNITVGSITAPILGQNVSQFLNTTWTNATTTNNSVNINNFVVRLLNNDSSVNRTLYTTTTASLNLTNFNMHNQNLSIRSYYIQVEVNDSFGNKINYSSVLFNYVSNSVLNVSVQNISGGSISSFNLSVFNLNTSELSNYQITTGLLSLDLIRGYSYILNVSAYGYALANASISIVNSSQSYNFTLYPSSSIFLNIFNEVTLTRITENISIILTDITHPFTTTKNTVLGAYNFTNLAQSGDTYEVHISSQNYSDARYYVVVLDTSALLLNVYLLPNSVAQNFSICFYDSNSVIISNLAVYENLLSNSSYILVQSGLTDINGRVRFSFNPSNYYYYNYSSIFYSSIPFILNPPSNAVVLADGCNYDVTLQFASSTPSYSVINVTGSASFDNGTSILTFGYVSHNSSYSLYNMSVYRIVNSLNVLICSGTSGALTNSFACNTSGYSGLVYVTGYADNSVFFGKWIDITIQNVLGNKYAPKDGNYIAGFIMLVIVLAGVGLGGSYGSGAGIVGVGISGIIGLFALYWMQIASTVTVTLVVVDILVTIIILVGVSRRR